MADMADKMADTLIGFLLARIDEDDESVSACGNPPRQTGFEDADPVRVLAESRTKRRIVDMFPNADRDGEGWNEAGIQVLELLARPYMDHPDYDDAWWS